MQITATREHKIHCGHSVYEYMYKNKEGPCARLHGHEYTFFFTITASTLDNIGMVLDFSVIKDLLCKYVDENWDHRFLIYEKDPRAQKLKEIDSSVVIIPFNPTAEQIAQYLLFVVGPEQLKDTNCVLSKVIVYETSKCSAEARLGL